jgi:hypothetical protein
MAAGTTTSGENAWRRQLEKVFPCRFALRLDGKRSQIRVFAILLGNAMRDLLLVKEHPAVIF